MPLTREIALSQLRLDPVNPRLDDGSQTQREALLAMMHSQGEKLLNLARDIVHAGLSPLDRFLVLEAEDSPDEYVVLEGNRRFAALKLLLNPDLASGTLSVGAVRQLKTLAATQQFRADTVVDCVVVETRDEAIHWLRLRHGGQLDGSGTVSWGATERDRFESRSGKSSPELQLLQFAVGQGVISDEQANLVSITNLRRLLSDSAVRDTIGVEVDRKASRISSAFPVDELRKPIKKLLDDLAADDFRVAKIYTKGDRAGYMKEFTRSHRPRPESRRPANAPLTAGATAGSTGSPAGTGKRGGRVKARRRTVAPPSLSLRIAHSRLKEIYRELQRLRVEDHANAGAVLLRVFLELTVDHYLRKHTITSRPDATLASRLQFVHDDLLNRAVMSKAELAPIRKAISGKDLVAASISLFNLYVHELSLSPSPNDVRVAWDNLELLFKRIWS